MGGTVSGGAECAAAMVLLAAADRDDLSAQRAVGAGKRVLCVTRHPATGPTIDAVRLYGQLGRAVRVYADPQRMRRSAHGAVFPRKMLPDGHHVAAEHPGPVFAAIGAAMVSRYPTDGVLLRGLWTLPRSV